MSKAKQLEKLANQRQNTPLEGNLKGYHNIHDFYNGRYDCNYVSPYTKAAHNVESDIFVLLQDWASEKVLRGNFDNTLCHLGYDPSRPTNKNLINYLQKYLKCSLESTYATNLFPFIKPGSMSKRLPAPALKQTAKDFALPQIDIIRPRLVVALGISVYNAIRHASGHKRINNLTEAASDPIDINGSRIWCQPHPSRTNKSRDRKSWTAMSEWYNLKVSK